MTVLNPLRDRRDKRLPRIAGPCGLVIFGVTGDLSRKKLMPAVYDLANRGLLPPSFALTDPFCTSKSVVPVNVPPVPVMLPPVRLNAAWS